jgi:hypothetical protein
MSSHDDAVIADALVKLRVIDEVHTAVVQGIVDAVRTVTGRDISGDAPKPPAAKPLSEWWDWSPRRFRVYLGTLQRAADVMGLERFADQDEFTLRDLVELTGEIDLQDGMNAMSVFREADRLTEGPS